MGSLIDTSRWVDQFRPTTPAALKDQVLAQVNQKEIWMPFVSGASRRAPAPPMRASWNRSEGRCHQAR